MTATHSAMLELGLENFLANLLQKLYSFLKFSKICCAIAFDKNVGTAFPICKFLSPLEP